MHIKEEDGEIGGLAIHLSFVVTEVTNFTTLSFLTVSEAGGRHFCLSCIYHSEHLCSSVPC